MLDVFSLCVAAKPFLVHTNSSYQVSPMVKTPTPLRNAQSFCKNQLVLCRLQLLSQPLPRETRLFHHCMAHAHATVCDTDFALQWSRQCAYCWPFHVSWNAWGEKVGKYEGKGKRKYETVFWHETSVKNKPQIHPPLPPTLLYNGYRLFPGGKGGRGVALTTHLHLVPRSTEKNRAIHLFSLRAFAAYDRVKPYIVQENICI